MKKLYRLILLTMFLLPVFNLNNSISYIPEQELIFDQQYITPAVEINQNLTIGIFVKNYFNYTITNVSISLNLTTITGVEFTSCDFGGLSGDNITFESTLFSSSNNGFTPTEINYGYMEKDFLRFNMSEILNGTKVIFYYNITAGQEGRILMPTADMIYLDNWGDKQEVTSRNEITVEFLSDQPTYPTNIPNWGSGTPISIGWGIVIFAIVPSFIAIVAGIILYFRRR